MENNPRNPENLGIEGDIEIRPLATHEIDAGIATLTVVLHLQRQTERINNDKVGYILV